MNLGELESVARSLVAPGKGILAADESSPTIEKRFKAIELPSTEENRRAYRDLLFTTPGVSEFISGVILYDETIRQRSADGTPFTKVLERQGIVPGIKVDEGAKALIGFPGEKITEGLDGLRERLPEYRTLGARFAKWRAVIDIGPGIPTRYCIQANAHALARYAALCQEAGLVPIVEPEVLMDGDHTIERCEEVTTEVLSLVYAELTAHRVALEGTLLKPNMVVSGKGCPAPGGRAAGRRSDGSNLVPRRPAGGSRDRLPLRRPDAAPGHGASERHERDGEAPVGTEFLLRKGAAGSGAQGVEGEAGERPGGEGGVPPAREAERGRPARELFPGDGGVGVAPPVSGMLHSHEWMYDRSVRPPARGGPG